MKQHITLDRSGLRLLYFRYRDTSLFVLSVTGLIVVTSIFLFVQFVVPQMQKWFSIQREIAATKEKIASLNQNIQYLSSVDQSALDENFHAATSALPSQSDVIGVLTAVAASTIRSGVTLDDFSFSSGGKSKEGTVQSIKLTLSVKGGLNDASKLIQEITSKVPLATVTSISSDGNSSSVGVQFYSKPLPQGAVDPVSPLYKSFVTNSSVLDKLKEWQQSASGYDAFSTSASTAATSAPF